MRSSAPVLCLLSFLAAPVAAQFATDFEALTASPAGTIITGQDSWYIPVAGSLDCTVMTYAGNTYGIPANPTGGANFFHARSMPANIFARGQRPTTLPANGIVFVEYDILCQYAGAALPTQNIGSFSFQPSTNSVYVNLLARWTALVASPPTWNADVVAGTGTPPNTVVTVLANPAFQNLPVNVWHRWGCTMDLVAGVHIDFRITNGATGITTIFQPAVPILLPRTVIAPMPTDFRFFAGGSDNVVAIDNVKITGAAYTGYGAGCAGSTGVPTLSAAAAPSSIPSVGTTMNVTLGNLPLSLGVMVTGFSNTTALGGAFALPLDLGTYGFAGCNLLADPLVSAFLVGAGNTATWSFSVPAGPTFLGTVLYNQGLSLDTIPSGGAFTNGGRMIIGD